MISKWWRDGNWNLTFSIHARRRRHLHSAGVGAPLRWGTQGTISAATGSASEIVGVTDDVHSRETGTD